MADDKLIFPIGFDLEAAVKGAGDAWDKKYADRLEKLIAKRPVNVKLKLDTSRLDDLDAVKRRLAELKIEPITPETKAAIKELAAELKTLAKALEQVQKYSARSVGASEVRASRIRINEERANAQAALAAQRAARAEYNLAAARDKDAQAATRGVAATRNLSREYKTQDGYISRLIKRLAVYAGFRQIANFLTSVREVTAEFELQRVSLGAIIQDQQRANQLFSEIKSFALQSPVSILDLTKYTKQLAAYKIGVDELFETTKKLTDVSVGLGVSMDRVVLAYGQTRATGYLRASEIRQFTEMGVPIVEELAAKLSKMNGELVTAAQVMDMVSKRAISFEMVKEVFDDMTSAGGMFYNMQEKQGNTLYGMWAKLGDAASVMYEQIGNTEPINEGMKKGIAALTEFMRNWKASGAAIAAGLGATGAMIGAYKSIMWLRGALVTLKSAQEKATIATKARETAQHNLNKALASGTAAEQEAAAAALQTAYAQEKAALKGVKAAGIGLRLGKGLLKMFVGGVTAMAAFWAVEKIMKWTYSMVAAHEAATRLTNTLSEIKSKGLNDISTSVNNFTALANAAVNAADGTKQQRDALEELNRTYGNIIPAQDLTIEKLREMKGEYTSLTSAIKENIAQQMLQQSVDTIKEEYGSKLKDSRQNLKNYLQKVVDSRTQRNIFNEQQADRVLKNYERYIDEGMNYSQAMRAALELEGEGFTQYAAGLVKNASGPARQFYVTQVGLKNAIKGVTDELSDSAGELGKYQKAWQDMQEFNANMTIKGKKGTFAYSQEQKNEQIKNLKNFLQTVLGDAWDDSYAVIYANVGEDADKMSELFWERIKEAADSPAQEAAVKKAAAAYYQIIPQDKTVRIWRDKAQEIAKAQDFAKDNARKFLIGDTQSLTDYRKGLEDEMKNILNKLKEYAANRVVLLAAGKDTTEQDNLAADLEKQRKYVEALLAALPTFETSRIGAQSDPRLQNLKEEISLVQKLYNEYKKLEKQEGASKAAADMEKMAGASIKALSDKYGISLPTTAKDLTSALEILYNKMAQLPKKVFPALDKDLRELRWTIENVNIDDAQKKIEEQLKTLSDRISRTKTAKEFYDRILSQTGDAEMAATLTMNVYGEGGEDLFNNTVSLLQEYFSGVEVDLPINFDTQQIDYKALRKIWETDKALPKEMRKIPEAYDSAIKQMLDSADSANQKMIEGWLKATEKAKDYSDKLADVYRTTATEIERINKAMAIGDIDAGIGSKLIAEYERKQAEDVAKLEYEAFKNMPLYVQMFDNLDNASTRMLENMRSRLIAMQGEWKNLDPTQLKEMQSRLNEIDAQLAKRNPFKTLATSIKKYRDLQRDHGSEKKLNREIEVATDAYLEAKAALKKQLEESPDDKEAVENLQKRVRLSEEELQKLQEIADAYKKVKDAIGLSADELMQMLNWAGDIAKAVAQISEALGADKEDVEYWNTVADSLSQVAGSIQDIVSAAMSLNVVNIISSVITAIPKMFVGFANLFNAGKIRNANKEINKQQKLLERLEYTYSRLEKAAEKVFGAEYISNYNRQLRVLNAQAEAYRKQAEAEKSKGKDADEDKIKEYKNAYRDTLDAIADMQGKLAEKFLGTDLTSAARDFAKAWLDAYKEFGNTADKMSEKFRDMIENMVVESLLARAMQRALEPTFKMIDEMREGDFYNPGFWKKVMESANKGAEAADAGAKVIMQWAKESFGYDPRGTASNLTGIKRDIAGATEETMSNVAAIGNTLMYYVSPIPTISADVTAMRQILERGATTPVTSANGEWTDWEQQAMDHYAAIQRNTADTVVECRRAAIAAEDAVTQLKRVITNNPSNTSYGVKVFA